MKADRPINLNLIKFRFPITAISSIFHRIAGVLLFLLLPWALYLLYASTFSADSFAQLQHLLANPWIAFLSWVLVCAAAYHLLAGIRHILMDFGWFETVTAAKVISIIIMLGSLVLFILAGVWLW